MAAAPPPTGTGWLGHGDGSALAMRLRAKADEPPDERDANEYADYTFAYLMAHSLGGKPAH